MKKSYKVLTRRILTSLLMVLLICSLPITALALPEPTTRTVGASGDYATIQAAVDAAVTGDTILVEAGTYTESVVVGQPNLTIRSVDGPATTIVEGVANTDVFYTTMPGVTIDGLTIVADNAAGIRLDFGATSGTVTDNVIGPKLASTCSYAVYVYELLDGALTITGNTISDCDYGIYQDDYFDNGTVLIDKNILTGCNNAVYLSDYIGTNLPVTVTISDNTISECYDGIYLYEVVDGTIIIRENDISFFEAEGIEVDEQGNGLMQITANTLTDGYNGIYLSAGYFGDEGSANIAVTDNEFLRCSDYGLYFYGIEKGTLLVSHNTAIDCYSGLCVEEMGEYYVVDAQITYNTVSASGDTLGWDLYEGISICCPEQETYLSYNKVSGYEYGFDIGDIGCCGVEPVIFTINNNEAFDCDNGFYIEDVPCCMPGSVDILNNWAHDNSVYGMYIDDIGYYESSVNIKGNVFTNNPIGLYVYSIEESNVTVGLNYNGFVDNIRSYVTEDDFAGLNATANWWATTDGPTAMDEEGGDIDMVVAEESDYTPWVTSLAFDKSSLSLSLLETSQLALIADLSDDTTVEVTDYVFSYTSSNRDVAIVSPSGLITAVGSGTAVITANCMGYTTAPSITVTVGTPPVRHHDRSNYTIMSATGAGGTISPSGSVVITENGSKMFTITPDVGYEIDDVLVDGKSVGKVAVYTFSGISSNHTIEAKFVSHESVCGADKFVDLDTSLWYHGGIDYVLLKGLYKGTSATTFEPNTAMTRAMLVTVLHRLEGNQIASLSNHFKDVSAGSWYIDAVVWAAENDIVKGYDAELFGPNDPITREQMAAILYRYASHKGYDMTASNSLTTFMDANGVSTWALTVVQWAVGEELITGVSDTSLEPKGNASRAQVATILMRFVENSVK